MTPDPYDGVSLLSYDELCGDDEDAPYREPNEPWHATLEADPEDDPADQRDFLSRYAGVDSDFDDWGFYVEHVE